MIGTRPEVIRSARLLSLLQRDPEVDLTLINSGQHYDWNMMSGFLEELGAPPVTHDVHVGPGHPVHQTGVLVDGIGRALQEERPDALAVFGDTNSSLAGAVAAARVVVPLVHIEAGCRSYDMSMPEEINRRSIDHMAALLLAVSEVGRANLEREDVMGRVEVIGDPLYDEFVTRQPERKPGSEEPAGLLTLHRPANVDDPKTLGSILDQLAEASDRTGVRWTFPVHPRTRGTVQGEWPGVDLVDPMLYEELLGVLSRADVCVTDSGGLQKEALWMEVPCVTVRTTTEWVETIAQGVNVLAPPGSDIAGAIARSLTSEERDFTNPYGDGHACERAVNVMKDWIEGGARFPARFDPS
ncbi:MAG: non-hydrolyzing UDP-N-acetylglucosamine 2-epimerase [Actinomycetota bacterium]